jgi:hypothetical protein
VVRPADQVARGLLELRALSQATIGVWDLPRQDWRASALCISLLENTWVRERGLRFVPLSLPDLVSDAECSLPLAAFVHLFDEPERQRGFLSRLDALREKTGVDALLTGPWLGSTTALFEVGSMFPFGESLSPPEGPFGFRFARAREAWLSSRKIDCHNERVVALRKVDDGVEIDCFLDHGERRIRKAGLCIVATGGLVGGGVELLFDASGSALGSPLDSGPRSPSGALEGWDPQADGGLWLWPPHQGEGARANRGLIFAGDVCGPSENLLLRRGTILSACASGKVAADCLSKGARCALSEE